jgi:hypothetical protein
LLLFRGAPERPGGNRDVNPPSVRLEHPAGLVLTRIRTSYAHGWRAWPCACQSAHVAGPGATVPGVVQFGMPGDPQFCRDQARRCADMSAVTKNAEMRKLVEDLAVKWLPRAILEANKEYKPQPRRYVDYVFSRRFAHASHCRQAVKLRLGLFKRRRVVVRVHVRRLADHPVQCPEPTHVGIAALFVDTAHRPLAAVDSEILPGPGVRSTSPRFIASIFRRAAQRARFRRSISW